MKTYWALALLLFGFPLLMVACGGSNTTPSAPSGPTAAMLTVSTTPTGGLFNTPTMTPTFGNGGEVITLAGQAGTAGIFSGRSVTVFGASPTPTPTLATAIPGAHSVGWTPEATIVWTPAQFNAPSAVAMDQMGNIFVADSGNEVVREIDTSGNVMVFAGQAGVTGATNGAVTQALFRDLAAVAVGPAGDLFVADSGNNMIRKISVDRKVSTFAGSGIVGATDATGTEATFNHPQGLAVDKAGNLYVADTGNNKIREITPEGVVTTLAGSGEEGAVDAQGVSASFDSPVALAVDESGNVYVADEGNQVIRKVAADGKVTTLAGKVKTPGFFDGPARIALFKGPAGITVDPKGTLYVSDKGNQVIRRISKKGIVSTLAGQVGAPGAANGTSMDASFKNPAGLSATVWGSVLVADKGNELIRIVR